MTKLISEIKRNRLNVYLIKDNFKDEDSITKKSEDAAIQSVVLKDVGIFYFKKSEANPPDWLSSFFNNHPAINPAVFFGSGTKAVLISKIQYRGKVRFFAIPFG